MSNASVKSYNKPYSKSRSKGKGWHEKAIYLSSINRKVAPRHRKAALKGSGSTGRQGSVTSAQIHRKMDRRSKRSQLIDRSKQAKHVGNIRSKKDREEWRRNPNQMDLQGVDTRIARDQYKARVTKKQLKQKRQVKRKITKQIVKKKEQVKRVKKPEEKQRLQKEIKQKEQEKQKVELDIRDVEVGHRKTRESIHSKQEEKKEVMYVMRQTDNNNYIESKNLLDKVESKGLAYDEVDWDELEGSDLTYDDRVRRLDQQIGHTYTEDESEHLEEKYEMMREESLESQRRGW